MNKVFIGAVEKIPFSVYYKGKRKLITFSGSQAAAEAKTLSSILKGTTYIKYDGNIVGIFRKGKKVKF